MKTVLIVDDTVPIIPLKFDLVPRPIEVKTGRQKRRERRKQERKK